jgi:hypothetical protein
LFAAKAGKQFIVAAYQYFLPYRNSCFFIFFASPALPLPTGAFAVYVGLYSLRLFALQFSSRPSR